MERGDLVEQKAEGGWRSGEGRPQSWDSGGSLRSSPGTEPPTGSPNTEKRRLVDQNATAPPDDRENRLTGPPTRKNRNSLTKTGGPGRVKLAEERNLGRAGWPELALRPGGHLGKLRPQCFSGGATWTGTASLLRALTSALAE